jgi:hypothetical protein
MSAPASPVPDRAVDRAMYENRMRAAAYRAAAGTAANHSSTAGRAAINRAAVNRKNAQHSTGPRTEAGKQRSSLNAIRHGLTAQTVVLPSEDAAAYESHRRQFFSEYQPATPTETQLVQELIDTSWRLNRIPLLEADLLARAANPPDEQARIDFDIVDAHRLIAGINLQGTRLSRQFQKSAKGAARTTVSMRNCFAPRSVLRELLKSPRQIAPDPGRAPGSRTPRPQRRRRAAGTL